MPQEAHRLNHRDVMDELCEALEKRMWKSRVFEASLALAGCLIEHSPNLDSEVAKVDLTPLRLRNQLTVRIRKARKHFAEEEFELAVREFAKVVDELAGLPHADPVSLDHLRTIKTNYQSLARHFEVFLDKELEFNLGSLLSAREQECFLTMRKHHSQFDEVRENARLRIRNRKRIWYCIVEDESDALKTSLQSPK
jgi:glutaredoxin-related protein